MTLELPLDRTRLRQVLEALPSEFLRAKGVLDLADADGRQTIYQRVSGRWTLELAEP